MKKRAVKKETDKVELQMTSMIDVVFLLLIFFIVTMQFPEDEGTLPAYLPKEVKGIASKMKPKEKKKDIEDITISLKMVGESPEIAVGNSILPNFRQLSYKLKLLHKQFPEHRIVLDGAPNVKFDFIVRALNACIEAEYLNVSFTAPPPSGGPTG